MEQTRVYLDTSVYLAVLLGEKVPKIIVNLIQKSVLCSSTLILIETERNLIRLTRERLLTSKEYAILRERLTLDQEAFILRDLTPDLCLTADFPAVKTPRSSDLAHLRTAKWFLINGGLSKFLTLDHHQLAAAREMHLPV